MRMGAGEGLKTVLIFFLFWGLSLTYIDAQEAKIIQQFKDYDVLSYDLELQFSMERSRIAGTQVIRFRPKASIRSIWLNMGPELKIDKLTWKGKPINFDYLGEIIRVDFPEMLREEDKVEIRVVFFGNLKGSSPYPVWQKNNLDQIQIGLDDARLPPHYWWPCKTLVPDPVEKMKLRIILPEEASFFSSGSHEGKQSLPGRFTAHDLTFPPPLLPEEVSLYIGNFETLSDTFRGESHSFPLTYFIQPQNKSKAYAHLAQVKRIFASLEQYFGPYPHEERGYTWFQPLVNSSSAYLLKNNPWGFDPVLLRDLSHQWTSFLPRTEDSLGRILNELFPYFVEYLIVEKWYDRESANEFLVQNPHPAFRRVALLQAARERAVSDHRWMQGLIEYLKQENEEKVADNFLTAYWGADAVRQLKDLMNLKQKPQLQYHMSKKRRKLRFYYRWKNIPTGFSYPLFLDVKGKEQKLIPGKEWKSLTFKKVSPKDINWKTHAPWYDIQEEKFLTD